MGSIGFAGSGEDPVVTILGSVAVFCSMVNITGGYLITYRMLSMFKRSKRSGE